MGTCHSSSATTSTNKVTQEQKLLHVTQRSLPGLVRTLPSSARDDGEIEQHAYPEVECETSHPIFKAIEDIHTKSGVSFGRLLDAGTGLGSLQWIAHLTSEGNREKFGVSDWTAVTASKTMIQLCREEGARLGFATKDHLVFGNWFGEDDEERINFPNGEDVFDCILVDYLIGAMDAFSPFRQDCIFEQLAKHLKEGGRLYLLGMEPIPETQFGVADLVCKTKRLRDACILLAGKRCYREHPISWVERNLKRSGLNVVQTSKFPLLHREKDIIDQLGTARWMLRHIKDDSDLTCGLEDSIDRLEGEIRTTMHGKPIRLGFDYLVVAEKPDG